MKSRSCAIKEKLVFRGRNRQADWMRLDSKSKRSSRIGQWQAFRFQNNELFSGVK